MNFPEFTCTLRPAIATPNFQVVASKLTICEEDHNKTHASHL